MQNQTFKNSGTILKAFFFYLWEQRKIEAETLILGRIFLEKWCTQPNLHPQWLEMKINIWFIFAWTFRAKQVTTVVIFVKKRLQTKKNRKKEDYNPFEPNCRYITTESFWLYTYIKEKRKKKTFINPTVGNLKCRYTMSLNITSFCNALLNAFCVRWSEKREKISFSALVEFKGWPWLKRQERHLW